MALNTLHHLTIAHIPNLPNRACIERDWKISPIRKIFSRVRPCAKTRLCTNFRENMSKIATCNSSTRHRGRRTDGKTSSDHVRKQFRGGRHNESWVYSQVSSPFAGVAYMCTNLISPSSVRYNKFWVSQTTRSFKVFSRLRSVYSGPFSGL